MKWLLTALCLLWATPADAVDLYVATTGTDSGNCRSQSNPCKTGQYAVNQIPNLSHQGYDVYFAAGVYSGTIDVAHKNIVNLRGNCGNPMSVVLNPGGDYKTIVTSQDRSVVGVNCMTLDGSAYYGTTGIFSRQIAIVDFRWVNFFAMPGGMHIAADYAAVSCTEPYYIYGGAVVHAGAGNQSVLKLPCQITIPSPVSFYAFIQAGLRSVASLAGAVISGTATGLKFTAQDGSCVGCNSAPGDQPGQIYGSGTVW